MTIDDKKDGAQYLTFLLDSKIFAFDVLKTREVLSLIEITPIPGTPDYDGSFESERQCCSRCGFEKKIRTSRECVY